MHARNVTKILFSSGRRSQLSPSAGEERVELAKAFLDADLHATGDETRRGPRNCRPARSRRIGCGRPGGPGRRSVRGTRCGVSGHSVPQPKDGINGRATAPLANCACAGGCRQTPYGPPKILAKYCLCAEWLRSLWCGGPRLPRWCVAIRTRGLAQYHLLNGLCIHRADLHPPIVVARIEYRDIDTPFLVRQHAEVIVGK